jgi:methionine sulfoxide reductase heme-binding subunit
MGGKRWQALHRLIYFSAAAGVIHYIWLVKADLRKPLQYAAVLAVLMAYRVVVWAGGKAKANQGVMAGPKMRVTEN